MAEKLTIGFDGYQLHAGGKELCEGGYAPTLEIAGGDGAGDRIRLDIEVTQAEAFATVREAQERAFELGMHWIKARR